MTAKEKLLYIIKEGECHPIEVTSEDVWYCDECPIGNEDGDCRVSTYRSMYTLAVDMYITMYGRDADLLEVLI